MARRKRLGGKTYSRRDRLVQEEIHDTYRARGKLPEPTRCPDCGAVFEQGRWKWSRKETAGAHEERCPACRRIRDAYPAGFVSLSGTFLGGHRGEIANLVRNEAEKEKAEHPLKRIMDIKETEEGLLVTTTDPHLARSIGEALARAYKGALEYQYTPQDRMLRVAWKRDL